ncbi:MAG: cytochrome c4 [Hoeflea sp.]|uniref:c-type cytochrome n=1 Tax=Hoeflea sp. TaxID=1940281 RepID=UPI001E13136A|nr:c-type cytochrome [Hoeflea sp.]MBU4528519.1 cytochrome c4 [Alphaproteobacteria bacterium]MBU4542392.1 cytochrome c4 [Alphaproteobacteria bacterium]MBU4550129.1 cytochrome c4 [Alphaproteobacteria bacterium]MBV1726123.1 cytochrome c4 [Hoeflea sp.]MBV1762733.1 cytochrome c4 [Hoeflea sp.]
MRAVLALALGGVFLAGSVLADSLPEGDRAEGRKLAGQCSTCHGLDGFARIPIAPHIGGEPESYLRSQLTAFRDGTREQEMMSIVARSLSDQQIADLAAWYSGHSVTVELRADPDDAPALCIACHGADGLHLFADAPNLAGETNIYIDTQLKAFRTGKREHEIMSAIAADMTDAEIRAVADWYAAVRIGIELVE